MGSIPVANPAPYQRPHLSRRGFVVLALPLALIAFGVTVVAFVWPENPQPARPPLLGAGLVDDLQVGAERVGAFGCFQNGLVGADEREVQLRKAGPKHQLQQLFVEAQIADAVHGNELDFASGEARDQAPAELL